MELNELDVLREQVKLQAERIGNLTFETMRLQAALAVIDKQTDQPDDKPDEQR